MKTNKNKIQYYLLIIIYRICLDIVFSNVVIAHYSYEGYFDAHSFSWIFTSWIILWIFSEMSYKYYDNEAIISKEVLFLLFIVSAAPFTSMVAFGEFPIEYVILNTSYWLLLFFWESIIPRFTFGKERNKIIITIGNVSLQSEIILYALAWFSFAIVLFISGYYMHFRLHFGLSSVYDIRRDLDNLNLPTIVYYAFSWTKAINPICLAYFILKKKRAYSILAILVQLFSFGINGMKATVFTTLVVIMVCFLPKFSIAVLNKFVLLGMNAASLMGLLILKVTGSFRLLSLILRRMVFTPNYISWCYYDFFQGKTPDFFRGSILQHFGFKTPYPDITKTIGLLYYGSTDYVSNNGLITDGIVNFGNMGAFIMPFFVILVLVIFDKCSEGLDNRLYISCSIPIVVTLISMFLSTALLTNGFIFIMILLYVMKRDSNIQT